MLRQIATIRGLLGRLRRDVAGNVLVMMAILVIPMALIAGSAIDSARIYFVNSRLQQACDAGALAGRKFMNGTEFTPTAQARANSFFANNFRDGMFGATTTRFASVRTDDNQVEGVATTSVPLSLMNIVMSGPVRLRATCRARLELPNLDVMFVLDTTGSMNDSIDGATKISSLRSAAISFFDAVEGARQPGVQIRYGFMPYATNVNVGMLLRREWMADNWTYQSREPDGTQVRTTTSTTTTTNGPWTTTGSATTSTSSGSLEACVAPPAENYTSTTESGTTRTSGQVRYWWERITTNGTTYSASMSASRCTITKTVYVNYVRYRDNVTQPCSKNCTTETTQTVWKYAPRLFDVSSYKGDRPDGLMEGGTFSYPIGNTSTGTPAQVPVTWNAANACIEERKTVAQTAYPTIPSAAWDLDVDRIPDPAVPDTQWKPALGRLVYVRTGFGNWAYDPVRSTSNYSNLADYSSGAYNSCASPARKLASITRSAFVSYMNGLQVSGNTYHDVGFLWGLRLISPTGLFADENATAPNGSDISRHIIFMTDGETYTNNWNYEAYGLSALDRRRTDKGSVPSNTTQNTIVANRLSALCTAAKQRNVTVWVIAFGTSLSTMLKNCANAGKSFQADDADQLNAAFANIASQIAKLRISR